MRKLYLDKNLQFVFGVTLVAIMGVSAIIPALPDIIEGLHIPPRDIGWIISAFTLPGVIFSPVVGILADRMGRKKVLVPSLFIFGIAGTACFFATDLTTLLVLRFIQGIGAAPLGVLYGTIIGDMYEGRERGQAMGYNASVLSMGTAIFPAIGGGVAMLGWNWPFLLPILAIPLGLLISTHMDTPEPKCDSEFSKYFKEALRLMKTRQVLALFATTLLTFIVLYGPIVTYLPLLLDQKYHASPAAIGLIFLAASFMTAIASFRLGTLTDKFGQQTLLIAGAVFYALSMLTMPHSPEFWHCVFPVLFFGLAQGLNIPTIMTMLTSIAPMEQRAAFMAVNGTVLRLAQTIAPVLMGLIFATFGMHAVFMAGLACALGILVLAIFVIR